MVRHTEATAVVDPANANPNSCLPLSFSSTPLSLIRARSFRHADDRGPDRDRDGVPRSAPPGRGGWRRVGRTAPRYNRLMSPLPCRGGCMDEEHTTAVVQRYLDELGGDAPAESAIRALLDRAVRRLHRTLPRPPAPETSRGGHRRGFATCLWPPRVCFERRQKGSRPALGCTRCTLVARSHRHFVPQRNFLRAGADPGFTDTQRTAISSGTVYGVRPGHGVGVDDGLPQRSSPAIERGRCVEGRGNGAIFQDFEPRPEAAGRFERRSAVAGAVKSGDERGARSQRVGDVNRGCRLDRGDGHG